MKENCLEEAIIDLFIFLSTDEQAREIANLNFSSEDEDNTEDIQNLKKTDTIAIVHNIRVLIENLVNDHKKTLEDLRVESKSKSEIEELLKQEEANLRKNIKLQMQMKLYCESLKANIDELETRKNDLRSKCITLQEELNTMKKVQREILEQKDKEISELKQELENNKIILSSYEVQSLKIAELETKFRKGEKNHREEIRRLEEKVNQLTQPLAENKNLNMISRNQRLSNVMNNSNAQEGRKMNLMKCMEEEEEELCEEVSRDSKRVSSVIPDKKREVEREIREYTSQTRSCSNQNENNHSYDMKERGKTSDWEGGRVMNNPLRNSESIRKLGEKRLINSNLTSNNPTPNERSSRKRPQLIYKEAVSPLQRKDQSNNDVSIIKSNANENYSVIKDLLYYRMSKAKKDNQSSLVKHKKI